MADENRDKTPAEERAEIGTPAGEHADRGRRRHGTQPLTDRGDVNLSEQEKQETHADLQADQSAHPEEMGGRVKGEFTEQELEEEGAELGAPHDLTTKRSRIRSE